MLNVYGASSCMLASHKWRLAMKVLVLNNHNIVQYADGIHSGLTPTG